MVTSTVISFFTAMPDLISLVHKSPMGLNRLNSTFRVHWATKLSNTAAALGHQGSPGLGRMTLDVSRTPDTNLIEEASGISKRQLTMKITGMAIKEQRPPSNRPLWYVHEPVFRQYNLDPQRVTSLVPLLPDKPPVMSPDDHQNGKRPPKRATNGTPTIRDLWSRPHPCHRASGKTVGSALTQEDDAPIAKRPCLDKEEVITIDSEPSPDGEGDGEGDGGAQEDEVAARFVAGGVAGVGLCASAVFKQDSLLQGAEPMVETFVLVEDEPHLRSE